MIISVDAKNLTQCKSESWDIMNLMGEQLSDLGSGPRRLTV